jgi:hypothetical protein
MRRRSCRLAGGAGLRLLAQKRNRGGDDLSGALHALDLSC